MQENSTYRIISVHDLITLRNTDAEYAEKNIPQVEAQLVAHVIQHIPLPALAFIQIRFRGVDPHAGVLLRLAHAYANRDRVHGDVHHDQQAELHGGIHIREIECAGARVP